MNNLILSLATLGGVAAALPAMTAASNAQPIVQRAMPVSVAAGSPSPPQGRR